MSGGAAGTSSRVLRRSSVNYADGYAIEQLLGAYGGMGSINDVVINNDSGNGTSEREGEATTTAELRTLLSAEPRVGTTSVASRPSVRSST